MYKLIDHLASPKATTEFGLKSIAEGCVADICRDGLSNGKAVNPGVFVYLLELNRAGKRSTCAGK
jgi:hypothetical protein